MIALLLGVALAGPQTAAPETREGDNEAWITALARVHALSPEQIARVREIVSGSELLGRGNPAVTVRPLSREQCQEKLAAAGEDWTDPVGEAVCGRPYMAPLYDPKTQTPQQATSCIDRLEFPDIPCEYPVVWVRAREAQELCQAVGKRLCDAHEWEGACQGELGPPDYRWDLAEGQSAQSAFTRMRAAHNRAQTDRRWSYGDSFQTGVCAQDSTKSPTCTGGSWAGCGSNHYPAGSFPGCQSPLGVGDLNGNAAEHMNLPLSASQLASAGGPLGQTEMKGSWFIWDKYRAHEDWCRWRAPYWHGGAVMAEDSHRNYHLGFRCCADLPAVQESSP